MKLIAQIELTKEEKSKIAWAANMIDEIYQIAGNSVKYKHVICSNDELYNYYVTLETLAEAEALTLK